MIALEGHIARGVTPWSDVVLAGVSVKVDANNGAALMERQLKIRNSVVSMYGLRDQSALLFSVCVVQIMGSLMRRGASAVSAV
jgi:hypothetical protein